MGDGRTAAAEVIPLCMSCAYCLPTAGTAGASPVRVGGLARTSALRVPTSARRAHGFSVQMVASGETTHHAMSDE
jgi:hypothetical protein